jgi:hypothetical protein
MAFNGFLIRVSGLTTGASATVTTYGWNCTGCVVIWMRDSI